MVLPPPHNTQKWLKLHVLNVGQGDTMMLEFPYSDPSKKFIWFIDCYGTSTINHTFDPFIKNYIEDIIQFNPEDKNHHCAVLITHPDRDHYKFLPQLIENYNPIGLFISPYPEQDTSDSYKRSIGTAVEYEIPIMIVKNKQTFSSPNGKFIISLYTSPSMSSKNNASVIMEIDYYGSKIYLLGDAEFPAQWELFKKYDNAITFLKVSHHGSLNGTFENMDPLKKVFFLPNFAVISVGIHKSYSHPDINVVNVLKQTTLISEGQYRLYRTDDFYHSGQYNGLQELRDQNQNDLISYIFGFLPNADVGVFQLYQKNPDRHKSRGSEAAGTLKIRPA